MVIFLWVLMVHHLFEVPRLQARQVARDFPGSSGLHRQETLLETPLETVLKVFRQKGPHL